MKSFDTRIYGISDFLEWSNTGLLELSPDFQRRAVWSQKAKSYLIDTILRGKPIPKLIIMTRLEWARTVRVVVDGQQRLRAILEFIGGDFTVSSAHNAELAGKRFDTLPKELRDAFMKYELGADLLFDLSYPDILDIFRRINSYTVTLNTQERLNAKYLGYFKTAAYGLGFEYVDYFLRSGALTKAQVTRMAEAELAGDMLMALLDGVQSNKSLEKCYRDHEDSPEGLQTAVTRFKETMSYVGTVYTPEDMQNTNWSRVHLFYTLFTSIAHCLFGLKGPRQDTRVPLGRRLLGRVRVCLDDVSDRFDAIAADLDNPNNPKDYMHFIMRSRRATTDRQSRIDRTEFVCGKIKSALAQTVR